MGTGRILTCALGQRPRSGLGPNLRPNFPQTSPDCPAPLGTGQSRKANQSAPLVTSWAIGGWRNAIYQTGVLHRAPPTGISHPQLVFSFTGANCV